MRGAVDVGKAIYPETCAVFIESSERGSTWKQHTGALREDPMDTPERWTQFTSNTESEPFGRRQTPSRSNSYTRWAFRSEVMLPTTQEMRVEVARHLERKLGILGTGLATVVMFAGTTYSPETVAVLLIDYSTNATPTAALTVLLSASTLAGFRSGPCIHGPGSFVGARKENAFHEEEWVM